MKMILVLKLIAGTIFPLLHKMFYNFTAEGEIFYSPTFFQAMKLRVEHLRLLMISNKLSLL